MKFKVAIMQEGKIVKKIEANPECLLLLDNLRLEGVTYEVLWEEMADVKPPKPLMEWTVKGPAGEVSVLARTWHECWQFYWNSFGVPLSSAIHRNF